MLRAISAQWKSQNKILRKAYRIEGAIADHSINLIYRRTHELVPADEYRQYTVEEIMVKEDDEDNHIDTSCSSCRSPKIQLQLTCKKINSALSV